MEMGGPEMAPIPPPRSALYLLGGLVADLEPVAIAVRPRQQGRPAAEPPEVPGLVTLAVIGPGDGDHLRRIPADEHVAQRRPLHFHAIAGRDGGGRAAPVTTGGNL